MSKDIYLQELENYLQATEYENAIYTGDINIISMIDNATTAIYLLLLQGHGFSFIMNSPTRLISSTCIDNISTIRKK